MMKTAPETTSSHWSRPRGIGSSTAYAAYESITTPATSNRNAANSTGGKYASPALIATNADPQTAARARNSERFLKRLTSALSPQCAKRFRKRPRSLARSGAASADPLAVRGGGSRKRTGDSSADPIPVGVAGDDADVGEPAEGPFDRRRPRADLVGDRRGRAVGLCHRGEDGREEAAVGLPAEALVYLGQRVLDAALYPALGEREFAVEVLEARVLLGEVREVAGLPRSVRGLDREVRAAPGHV